MNTATTTSANLPSSQPLSSSGNKPLWAAVGLLSAAVLAMGGTMLYRQGAQSAVTAAPVAALTAPAAATRTAAPLASNDVADDLVEKPAATVKKVVVKPAPRPAPAPRYAGVSPAPRAAAYPTNYPSNYPSSYPSSQPSPQAVNYPPANVCATCGSVESVTAVQRPGKPSPISVGSVAGYQVGVRMEDGSRRTIESATAPSVGSRVTVDGNGLQGQSGSYERHAAPMSVGYTQPSY
jgi:hypothetical protein